MQIAATHSKATARHSHAKQGIGEAERSNAKAWRREALWRDGEAKPGQARAEQRRERLGEAKAQHCGETLSCAEQWQRGGVV
jgi:hypothetical protein